MPDLEKTPMEALIEEAQRQVAICNGCRYCEGYCAVFPAMERLPFVDEGGLSYLANLCHDCRACFQACMYAPPHPFEVEIPRLLSVARVRSYERYARPRWLAKAFRAGPLAIAALTLICATIYLFVVWAAGNIERLGTSDAAPRSFYRVVPYALMAGPGLFLGFYVVTVVAWGACAFVREVRIPRTSLRAYGLAFREAATLRWLDGGGDECFYPNRETTSRSRRLLHHLTAYGFAAAFAATVLAAVYQDVAGEAPPFPIVHPVVLLGLAGGIGIAIGTTGLIWIKLRAAALGSRRETVLNLTFLVALDLTAATGLLLLAFRSTGAMGPLLLVHLGALSALYLGAPYGKAVHIIYRLLALVQSAATRVAAQDELRTDGVVATDQLDMVPQQANAS